MGMEMKATKSAVKKVPEMIITPQGERIIPAKRSRDGQSFRFDISIDHIIEQTLSRSFNRPDFRKSTIKITETVTDSESEEEDEVPAPIKTSEPSLQTNKPRESVSKGVPIKLHMKRLYAEDSHGEERKKERLSPRIDREQENHMDTEEKAGPDQDQPLDMSKERGDEATVSHLPLPSIPPSWVARGLTDEDLAKFRKAVANASVIPSERNLRKPQRQGSLRYVKSRGGVFNPLTLLESMEIDGTMTETDFMDRQLASMLQTITNDEPDKKPTITLNKPSMFRYRDLVGSVIERQLRRSGCTISA